MYAIELSLFMIKKDSRTFASVQFFLAELPPHQGFCLCCKLLSLKLQVHLLFIVVSGGLSRVLQLGTRLRFSRK